MFGRRRRADDFAGEIKSDIDLHADALAGEGWSEKRHIAGQDSNSAARSGTRTLPSQ
jgi:hypothetical protein